MDIKCGMYNDLDTLESLKKFLGISDIFDVFMLSSMSDLYIILQFLATGSVIESVETLDFRIKYVCLIGFTTLLSLICNRLFLVEL